MTTEDTLALRDPEFSQRVVAFVVAPFAFFVAYGGWYLFRSLGFQVGINVLGWGPDDYVRIGLIADSASIFAAIVAGFAVAAVGGWPVAAVGSAAMGLGVGLLAILVRSSGNIITPTSSLLALAWVLTSGGFVVVRMGVLSASFAGFPDLWRSGRLALSWAVFAGVHLAVLGLTLLDLDVGQVFRSLAVFAAVLTGLSLVTVATLGATAVSVVLPSKTPLDWRPAPIASAAAAALFGAIGLLGWAQASSAGFNIVFDALGPPAPSVFTASSWVTVPCCVLGMVGAAGLQFFGLRVPLLLLSGVGFLLVAGAGLAPLAAASTGWSGQMTAQGLAGFGEALCVAPLMAYAGGGVPWRVAGLGLGILLALQHLTSFVSKVFSVFDVPDRAVLLGGTSLGVSVGLILCLGALVEYFMAQPAEDAAVPA